MFSGLVQCFSDFMGSSKRADERESQEESKAETQCYFRNNFIMGKNDKKRLRV